MSVKKNVEDYTEKIKLYLTDLNLYKEEIINIFKYLVNDNEYDLVKNVIENVPYDFPLITKKIYYLLIELNHKELFKIIFNKFDIHLYYCKYYFDLCFLFNREEMLELILSYLKIKENRKLSLINDFIERRTSEKEVIKDLDVFLLKKILKSSDYISKNGEKISLIFKYNYTYESTKIIKEFLCDIESDLLYFYFAKNNDCILLYLLLDNKYLKNKYEKDSIYIKVADNKKKYLIKKNINNF